MIRESRLFSAAAGHFFAPLPWQCVRFDCNPRDKPLPFRCETDPPRRPMQSLRPSVLYFVRKTTRSRRPESRFLFFRRPQTQCFEVFKQGLENKVCHSIDIRQEHIQLPQWIDKNICPESSEISNF